MLKVIAFSLLNLCVLAAQGAYHCEVFVEPLSLIRPRSKLLRVTVFERDGALRRVHQFPHADPQLASKGDREAFEDKLTDILRGRDITVDQLEQWAFVFTQSADPERWVREVKTEINQEWREDKGSFDVTPMRLNSGEVALLYMRRARMTLEELSSKAELNQGQEALIWGLQPIELSTQQAVGAALNIDFMEFHWVQFLRPNESLFFNRMRQSLSKTDLASKSGLDEKIIAAAERFGRRSHRLSREEREKVATALNIDPEELGPVPYRPEHLVAQMDSHPEGFAAPISRSELLRQFREQRAISKSTLAEALQVIDAVIGDIEAGKREPRPDLLQRWMKALWLTPTEILQVVMAPSQSAR